MADRLERLVGELQAELESRKEQDRTRLAEWFAGVLDHERNKNVTRIDYLDAFRRGHGLDKEEDEQE